jgi:hypothetical protein
MGCAGGLWLMIKLPFMFLRAIPWFGAVLRQEAATTTGARAQASYEALTPPAGPEAVAAVLAEITSHDPGFDLAAATSGVVRARGLEHRGGAVVIRVLEDIRLGIGFAVLAYVGARRVSPGRCVAGAAGSGPCQRPRGTRRGRRRPVRPAGIRSRFRRDRVPGRRPGGRGRVRHGPVRLRRPAAAPDHHARVLGDVQREDDHAADRPAPALRPRSSGQPERERHPADPRRELAPGNPA